MSTLSKSASSSSEEDAELRRGPWTLEEDTLLIHYIASHGEGRWNLLAKCSGICLVLAFLFSSLFRLALVMIFNGFVSWVQG